MWRRACIWRLACLAALEARHHTGRGQLVETSLLESAMSFGVYEAAHVAATGERPPRLGQAHRGSSPYQVFPTADGWITVGAAQTNFWTRLCDLIGAPELKRTRGLPPMPTGSATTRRWWR